MEYFKHYDLPQIPRNLLSEISWSGMQDKVLDYGRRYYKQNQEVYAPRYASRLLANEKVTKWLLDIVPPELNAKYVLQTSTISTHDTQCEMIPHVDAKRTWTLNYYITTGGEHTEITWYQQRDWPVVRGPRPDLAWQQTPEGWADFDELIEVASTTIAPNSWCLLRTDILHGVKNITGTRFFISCC